jgi:transcriptional regulator with XRE-family HTH domain
MIKKIRKALDMTQTDLADLAGVSTMFISQVERHERKVNDDIAEMIADLVREAGGDIHADVIKGVQLHQYCTNQLPEIKSESNSPSEKAKLLSDVANVLDTIESLDNATGKIREGAREKRKQVEAALSVIEAWREKPFEPDGVAEELEKIV